MNNTIYQYALPVIMKKDGFIRGLQESRKILELQRKFEKGLIKESELSEEEKEKLIELYKEQIKSLCEDIKNNNMEIEKYKREISKMKKGEMWNKKSHLFYQILF